MMYIHWEMYCSFSVVSKFGHAMLTQSLFVLEMAGVQLFSKQFSACKLIA